MSGVIEGFTQAGEPERKGGGKAPRLGEVARGSQCSRILLRRRGDGGHHQ